MTMRVRITTGSRLHFGLLDVGSPFGGCGVMIDQPQTIVEAEPAKKFRIIVPGNAAIEHSQRIESIAEGLADGGRLPAVEIRLIQVAPQHTGLGSGTQISLAVAEAMIRAQHSTSESVDSLADPIVKASQRGLRSAVGTHGYFHGGFLVEGLDAVASVSLNSLDTRLELPAAWRAVVLLPANASYSDSKCKNECISGSQEQEKFDQLPPSDSKRQALKLILNDQILPAVKTSQFAQFTDSVTRYNRASGDLFASVQGGPYNGPATTRLIETLLAAGHRGVGQSSWGPGVFVWFEDPVSAANFCRNWSDKKRVPLSVSPITNGRRCDQSQTR